MTETFTIIWPERRTVSAEQIASWYADAVDDGRVPLGENRATTPRAMALVLEDIGFITLGARAGGAS